jgi:SagB-type dehydrogenase family enzyme
MSTPTTRYRRSPHLILYWSSNQTVLLNSHTLQSHNIHPNLIKFLSELNEWSSAEEITINNTNTAVDTAELAELHKLGLLESEDDAIGKDSRSFEWDPIELTVQRRTAHGGYWPDLSGPAPPMIRPRFTTEPSTDLPSPAVSLSMTLAEALERRRTVRKYGERPLCLEELSSLLHHSARPIECVSDLQLGDRILRPFPTAGARSELEIYVISVNIAGLERGAFYYDTSSRRLLRLREPDDHYARIVHSVHTATGGKLSRDPPVILLITAVFERVMWKYHGFGLSLIYKDVGALFQTLYLVAAALNLAPCAIGSGDEAENSRWLGLDPLCESQVGCFVVGPRED